MLLIVGYLVVLASVLGGFIIAGGDPILLLHVSEFVVIGGVAIGVLIIASPKSVIMDIIHDIKANLAGGSISKEEFIDLMKALYELFSIARRNGMIALDEHLSDPKSSSILSKYPSFLKEEERVEFLCNALRPIVDGKIKPDQLEKILDDELYCKEMASHSGVEVLNLVGDSLPGIGIVAAVLGIINTMSSISAGPEAVGEKVAAALTGTFLGVLFAYGFINPLVKKIQFTHKSHLLYLQVMSYAIISFAKGLAPAMAIEVARRSLTHDVQPGADELETLLKSTNSSK
jgi:chemotaxis protein MotA